MNDARYWLWIQNAFGAGAKIGEIISEFGSARAVFEAGEDAWLDSQLFGNNLLSRIPAKIISMKRTPLSAGDETLAYCKANSIGILTPDDEDYPKQLLSMNDYPAVLFYKGDQACLSAKNIFAVIGTREPSDYGREACRKITREMVRNGSVIVSGGALGIDSTAHRTCVEMSSPTVLVMGTGFDTGYLKQNEELRENIVKSGCIVTEYAPKVHGSAGSFPLRNRIVAALSLGIIVFEAGEKSGTLNTCKHARRLGKPVFVLPGAIDAENYIGSNRLIDEGAVPVFSAKSIYLYYDMPFVENDDLPKGRTPFVGIEDFTEIENEPNGISRTRRLKSKKADSNEPEPRTEPPQTEKSEQAEERHISENYSKTAVLVYNAVRDGNRTLDDIVRALGLPVFKIMRAVSELEMDGKIKKSNSSEYSIG